MKLLIILISPLLMILFHITLLITFILNPILPKGHTLYRDIKQYGGYKHCIKSMFKDVGGWAKYTYFRGVK